MTLDEAIKRHENLAEYHANSNKNSNWHYANRIIAEEYKQIAEWLKELQAYRKAWCELQKEIEKINPDENSFSIKNNACMLVKQYKPKESDIEE